MASRERVVARVREQMADAGDIAARKMFGEYGLYRDGVFFGLVCDDRTFIKVTPAGEAIAGAAERGAPYPGAKPHIVLDEAWLADRRRVADLVVATCGHLASLPKRR